MSNDEDDDYHLHHQHCCSSFLIFCNFDVGKVHNCHIRVCLFCFCLFLGNADALNLVDTALFCLAFEDSDNSDPIHLSRLFLYGDAASRLLITPALIDK